MTDTPLDLGDPASAENDAQAEAEVNFPDPVPDDERSDYEPPGCPNGHPTRVVTWLQPPGMEGEAMPTSWRCDECGWRSEDEQPDEVAIP